MARQKHTMAPSYEQNTAKIGEIDGTGNLGFKRPVHEGYMAVVHCVVWWVPWVVVVACSCLLAVVFVHWCVSWCFWFVQVFVIESVSVLFPVMSSLVAVVVSLLVVVVVGLGGAGVGCGGGPAVRRMNEGFVSLGGDNIEGFWRVYRKACGSIGSFCPRVAVRRVVGRGT